MSHILQVEYYKGAIAALEHILETGLDKQNVKLTLEAYRGLLLDVMPDEPRDLVSMDE